jgi:hypothetical protein
MAFHDLEGEGSLHGAINWEYADATARLAATGFTAGDVTKQAWQHSDETIWMLKSHSPITWIQTSTGTGLPFHKSAHENGGSDEISVAGLSGVLADDQDAGWIRGSEITITSVKGGDKFYYNQVDAKWENEPLPIVRTALIPIDWSPSWSDLAAYGSVIGFTCSVVSNNFVGNATVAYLNGLSPTATACYVITDSGTLTAGSVAVTPGAVVIYSGAIWILAVPGLAAGFVAPGVRLQLSSTIALRSPYTDGTDDGKFAGFLGNSLTGVLQTSGIITLTLPSPYLLPNDACIRGPFYLINYGGTYTLKIVIAGGLAFSDGLSQLWLIRNSEVATLGAALGDIFAIWMRIATHRNSQQVERAATWASSNFSSDAAIPFDTEDQEGNPYISDWALSPNPTRITAVLGGEYFVSAFCSINSTGGSAWNCVMFLRKGGSTTISGTTLRTGNSAGNDATMTLPPVSVTLAAGEYIEVVLNQDNLTGTLYNATVRIERIC